ncbi:MAG: hypothetical protein ACLPYS_14580, partial [Vulcanimicrobiaceae bacterium]
MAGPAIFRAAGSRRAYVFARAASARAERLRRSICRRRRASATKKMATERLRVFISYTHDSPEHGDRVLAFANRLVIN